MWDTKQIFDTFFDWLQRDSNHLIRKRTLNPLAKLSNELSP